ncbi:MAG: ribonuclease HI [Selenomonadaceae bacterium]|nr:ribonuclease HI [Selenomonadaceae bacterium]MDY2686028.1 ribonuclease HI [Selenomonadaceae bacterium]
MAEKKKVYAVKRGRSTGLFNSWPMCQKQVAGFPGAVYKGFATAAEAMRWLSGVTGAEEKAYAAKKSQPRASIPPARAASAYRTSPVSPGGADYIVYTDGSCLRNPNGPGGWAAVITEVRTGAVTELSDGEHSTTNNRMELSAAIAGLSAIETPSKIALYTDSQYLRRAFVNHWLVNWKRRGWKKADGNPVLNQDLWMRLDALYSRHQVQFHWVKGHVGIEQNERCDQLAKAAAMAHR